MSVAAYDAVLYAVRAAQSAATSLTMAQTDRTSLVPQDMAGPSPFFGQLIAVTTFCILQSPRSADHETGRWPWV